MTTIIRKLKGWKVSPEAGVLQIVGVMLPLILALIAIPLAKEILTIDDGMTEWVEDSAPNVVAIMYSTGMLLTVLGVMSLCMIFFRLSTMFLPDEEDSVGTGFSRKALRWGATITTLLLFYLWAVWIDSMEFIDIWPVFPVIIVLLSLYRIPKFRRWFKSKTRRNRVKYMSRRIDYHLQKVSEAQKKLARLEEHIRTHPA